MSKCTDKSDATLPTASVEDDIMSKGIKKVTLEDDNNAPPCDIISVEEEDMNSEKKCTSREQNLEHIKTIEVNNTSGVVVTEVSTCANCGKEGATNTCNKCKMVKYCNAACKKKHKTKHKKACERRVAELRDIELFKKPPSIKGDCPICYLRIPTHGDGSRYKTCCGKVICSGCIYAVAKRDKNALCPFCRVPSTSSDEECNRRMMKRVEVDDARAIHILAGDHNEGMFGLPINHTKALELYLRAADGYAPAYYNIGCAYYFGKVVGKDDKKTIHYWELGAIRGCTDSRYNLGLFEEGRDNKRAMRHYMIAAGSGYKESLKKIQELYSKEKVTKDEYAKALRAYQKYLDEVKSSQRDEAAAFDERYKYIK